MLFHRPKHARETSARIPASSDRIAGVAHDTDSGELRRRLARDVVADLARELGALAGAARTFIKATRRPSGTACQPASAA